MTIQTYLPVFTGFYGTIWEADETNEIDYINEQRSELGLEPITYDECRFDYADYNMQVVKGIAAYLEREFPQFVKDIKVEKIVSPRFYNYSNDSADVVITLTKDNQKTILEYLEANREAFASYLRDHYTSCSGFISSYPNSIELFMEDSPLEHSHKLGSILNFIFHNEDSEIEMNTYYNVEKYLSVANYDELVP